MPFRDLINPETGRPAHVVFQPRRCLDGRLSSSDPNLQNIPIRTESGAGDSGRHSSRGRADHVLVSPTTPRIELRIMAHISGDEASGPRFSITEDISRFDRSEGVRRAARRCHARHAPEAKEVNFGIMYGIAAFGLGEPAGDLAGGSAGDHLPVLRAFPEGEASTSRRPLRGEARRIRLHAARAAAVLLPDINSRNQNIRGNAERQAINMPIQGRRRT